MAALVVALFLILACALRLFGPAKVHREYRFVKTISGSANPVAAAITRGYNTITRRSEEPFFLRYWQKDYLILPAKYLRDVRRATREQLNFADCISDLFFMYKWIGDVFKSQRMVFAVIKGINPQMPKLSPSMFEEAQYAFEKEFGNCKEPTPLSTLDVMTRITVRVMTRVIIGMELSRDEKYLKAIDGYMAGNFLCGMVMLKFPFGGFVRDAITWPLRKWHQIFNQRRLIKMIEGVVKKRIDEFGERTDGNHTFDALTLTLKMLPQYPFDPSSKQAPEQTLSHETLMLVWASGQSPAMSATTVVFKLLEEPKYQQPLRNEAKAAIRKYGWNDPIFNELPMMDSFIRETHRLYPAFSINATRIVQGSSFTFSDGLTVPPGTRIGFAAEAMQRDPDIMADPETFDGFRFVKLASKDMRHEDGVNKWAASHCSFSNLTFGYGNHACPGRFIAIRLLKIMLCKLLLSYDIEWDGEGDQKGEPPRFVIEGASIPNLTQKIMIRRKIAGEDAH